MSSSLRLSLSALANNKQSICNAKPWWITMCAWAVHDLRSGGCESVQFQMPVIALMFDGPVCQTEFMVALTLRNQTPRKAINYSPAWNQLLLLVSLYIEGPCWPNGGFFSGEEFSSPVADKSDVNARPGNDVFASHSACIPHSRLDCRTQCIMKWYMNGPSHGGVTESK